MIEQFYLNIKQQLPIRSIDMTLSGTATLSQCRRRSAGNKRVFHILQISSITGTSQLDCLVSYPGHSLGGIYPSAEMQLLYSTSPAEWAMAYFHSRTVFHALTLNSKRGTEDTAEYVLIKKSLRT